MRARDLSGDLPLPQCCVVWGQQQVFQMCRTIWRERASETKHFVCRFSNCATSFHSRMSMYAFSSACVVCAWGCWGRWLLRTGSGDGSPLAKADLMPCTGGRCCGRSATESWGGCVCVVPCRPRGMAASSPSMSTRPAGRCSCGGNSPRVARGSGVLRRRFVELPVVESHSPPHSPQEGVRERSRAASRSAFAARFAVEQPDAHCLCPFRWDPGGGRSDIAFLNVDRLGAGERSVVRNFMPHWGARAPIRTKPVPPKVAPPSTSVYLSCQWQAHFSSGNGANSMHYDDGSTDIINSATSRTVWHRPIRPTPQNVCSPAVALPFEPLSSMRLLMRIDGLRCMTHHTGTRQCSADVLNEHDTTSLPSSASGSPVTMQSRSSPPVSGGPVLRTRSTPRMQAMRGLHVTSAVC